MAIKIASAQENINSISFDSLRGRNILSPLLSKKSLIVRIIKFFGDNYYSVRLW